ncbi:UbiX family flavin prenyltransferase [Agromyces aerolatus]|uniref:UbiX family flavin prenyltransferase n=1 Tax=Agromyces sp. LY-1074 TaxID=3074080 RepID=UPI00285C1546|nr:MULTISPECIES: UbiX family flavin prenyltransferase [unclassified Agromyces]MDR5700927.1 UbiX family flavin prenyltransferase [Agromyces sp. LY-1074]MDR5707412.1 UbiX family flavin prenyltransferase [Agromyces sp. LY-1358]
MSTPAEVRRIVVAITGASGAAYGVRALELCRDLPDVETHLVISRGARSTIHSETGSTISEVSRLADVVYSDADLGAAISSGSFRTDGMIVAPCSVKTLSGIANAYDDNLVVRAADVTLKEGRPLLLLVRETPLHVGHLRLMTMAAESGAVIYPPVPAFYTQPASVAEIVDHTARRALERIGVVTPNALRWVGIRDGAVRDLDGTSDRVPSEGTPVSASR